MLEKTLTVHFRGICTHFRGIVPGVPHRVVMPNAMEMRSGLITLGTQTQPYSIYPHVAFLATPDLASLELTAAGLIDAGVILNGVRLEIINAVDPLTYDPSFDSVLQLTNFAANYRPSSEVAFGGRAICYFDLFGGNMTANTTTPGGPVHTDVVIRTDGDPVLQVTPLYGDPAAATAPMWEFELPAADLWVGNFGPFCGKSDKFDFLLNYLTAQGGIPTEVSAQLPLALPIETGPCPDPQSFMTPTGFKWPSAAELLTRMLAFEGTTLACSDTRYP